MPANQDIALMAHLMRRAGFGATRDELERRVEEGYEATVEWLLHPEDEPPVDDGLLYRYLPMSEVATTEFHGQLRWLYHMRNTRRPLEEKMALFWHQVFATAFSKLMHVYLVLDQVEMLKRQGMGNFRDLLVELARDPAMIFWLDNSDNHKRAPNENWGRELLELFSMGIGNYTEEDVYEAARAFTGWTIEPKIPAQPWGGFPWAFEYRAEDHDDGSKSFLGHTGDLNGEDVVDIIVRQPACATFIARHLYSFFVADEPQVPAWPIEPPRDPDAIEMLSRAFIESGYEIRPVLRTLFNADFFREATYSKVKSPVEVVVGTLKLTGDLEGPDPEWAAIGSTPGLMGQDILNPPSVEGWHTGKEWLSSGSLITRVNFVAERVGDPEMPGVRDIVGRIAASNGTALTPKRLVEACLDQMGPLDVAAETQDELVAHTAAEGNANSTDPDFDRRVADVLALIAATREYQFG